MFEPYANIIQSLVHLRHLKICRHWGSNTQLLNYESIYYTKAFPTLKKWNLTCTEIWTHGRLFCNTNISGSVVFYDFSLVHFRHLKNRRPRGLNQGWTCSPIQYFREPVALPNNIFRIQKKLTSQRIMVLASWTCSQREIQFLAKTSRTSVAGQKYSLHARLVVAQPFSFWSTVLNEKSGCGSSVKHCSSAVPKTLLEFPQCSDTEARHECFGTFFRYDLVPTH